MDNLLAYLSTLLWSGWTGLQDYLAALASVGLNIQGVVLILLLVAIAPVTSCW